MNIRKELSKGTLGMMVLGVLSSGEMYGYQIIQVIARESDSVFNMKEGTLYPILHSLESEGYLTSYLSQSESGRQRKYYKITPRGENMLREQTEEWNVFSEAVKKVLKRGIQDV